MQSSPLDGVNLPKSPRSQNHQNHITAPKSQTVIITKITRKSQTVIITLATLLIMNVYLILLSLTLTMISVTSGGSITNNNFGRPGQSITNNNNAYDDDDVIINHNTPGGKYTYHSRGHGNVVYEESDCRYGTIVNNNQGHREVICLPPGVPSSINNNN